MMGPCGPVGVAATVLVAGLEKSAF
jgi:hypothetical protein